jgi:hypothetical protein
MHPLKNPAAFLRIQTAPVRSRSEPLPAALQLTEYLSPAMTPRRHELRWWLPDDDAHGRALDELAKARRRAAAPSSLIALCDRVSPCLSREAADSAGSCRALKHRGSAHLK